MKWARARNPGKTVNRAGRLWEMGAGAYQGEMGKNMSDSVAKNEMHLGNKYVREIF